MTKTRHDESGFTLIELMVGMLLFSILSVGFYQVMVASIRGSDDTHDIARIAQEARLGFNRMVRDTREATRLISASDTSYRIWTDFDADGVVDADGYEYLEFSLQDGDIFLTPLSAPVSNTDPPGPVFSGSEGVLAGEQAELLIANVSDVGGRDIFSYASNFLQYDTDGNGETSATEIDSSPFGDGNGALNGIELDHISDVNYAFRVSVGDRGTDFFGQAQMRSRRYSDL